MTLIVCKEGYEDHVKDIMDHVVSYDELVEGYVVSDSECREVYEILASAVLGVGRKR